jgi:predicted RNase H-like nuclease (RuvC/YqgF family)
MANIGVNQTEQKKGIFSHPKQASGLDLNDVSEQMSNLSRRVRMLEESNTNFRKRFQVTEQNMLNKHRLFTTELKTIYSDINEIKKELIEIKDKVLMLIKELQSYAKKEDVKVLERYVNLWEPVNFVTQNEIKDIVKEILKRQEKSIKD